MFHDTFLNDEHRSHHTNKTSKYKLVGYKSNIPAHIWTNPGFNLISKVINPVTFANCLKGKKFIFYRQIMVLNFTRYPKSLILKVPLQCSALQTELTSQLWTGHFVGSYWTNFSSYFCLIWLSKTNNLSCFLEFIVGFIYPCRSGKK